MIQYNWWDIYGSLLLMSVLPVFLLLAAGGVAYWRLRRQNAFMDHQQGVSARIANQNASYHDMLAEQYRNSQERGERALAQSAEALRLHAAALEQLTLMNQTLNRVAHTIRGRSNDSQ
jgi:hypothetical protein